MGTIIYPSAIYYQSGLPKLSLGKLLSATFFALYILLVQYNCLSGCYYIESLFKFYNKFIYILSLPAIMKLFLPVLAFQKLKIARYLSISVRPKRPKNSIHFVSDKI